MQYGKAEYIKHLTDLFIARSMALSDEQKQHLRELNDVMIFQQYQEVLMTEHIFIRLNTPMFSLRLMKIPEKRLFSTMKRTLLVPEF